ncbi:hypothetical protein E2C01_062783 [Portunus trituberculatus]|uniref:Uncharacterized protein n=1 Tax=Portunus trituberculatus TaxID=210409 RepID=A0A5B7H7G1_PORTR|nr:hypothetical protein [Portunus trituberculatus]
MEAPIPARLANDASSSFLAIYKLSNMIDELAHQQSMAPCGLCWSLTSMDPGGPPNDEQRCWRFTNTPGGSLSLARHPVGNPP